MVALQKSEWRTGRILLWWGATLASIIALFQGSGSLSHFGIVGLVFCGGGAATLAVFEHGWHRAPHSVGVPIKVFFFLMLIWIPMMGLGYVVWPTDLEPAQVEVTFGMLGSPMLKGSEIETPTIGQEYGAFDPYKKLPEAMIVSLPSNQIAIQFAIAVRNVSETEIKNGTITIWSDRQFQSLNSGFRVMGPNTYQYDLASLRPHTSSGQEQEIRIQFPIPSQLDNVRLIATVNGSGLPKPHSEAIRVAAIKY